MGPARRCAPRVVATTRPDRSRLYHRLPSTSSGRSRGVVAADRVRSSTASSPNRAAGPRYDRGMWRRFRIVVAMLALGAVMNVGVAWGVELTRGHFDVECDEYVLPQAPGRPVTICRSPGFESVSPSSAAFPERLSAYPDSPWWCPTWQLSEFRDSAWATGWPMLSMKGASSRSPRSVRECVVLRLDRCPRWIWGKYNNGTVWIAYLPCQPIWPGFIVNSLLYAAIAWVACWAMTSRPRFRAWRGQCRRCGYPRGASSICSECGATVKPLVTSAPLRASPPSN